MALLFPEIPQINYEDLMDILNSNIPITKQSISVLLEDCNRLININDPLSQSDYYIIRETFIEKNLPETQDTLIKLIHDIELMRKDVPDTTNFLELLINKINERLSPSSQSSSSLSSSSIPSSKHEAVKGTFAILPALAEEKKEEHSPLDQYFDVCLQSHNGVTREGIAQILQVLNQLSPQDLGIGTFEDYSSYFDLYMGMGTFGREKMIPSETFELENLHLMFNDLSRIQNEQLRSVFYSKFETAILNLIEVLTNLSVFESQKDQLPEKIKTAIINRNLAIQQQRQPPLSVSQIHKEEKKEAIPTITSEPKVDLTFDGEGTNYFTYVKPHGYQAQNPRNSLSARLNKIITRNLTELYSQCQRKDVPIKWDLQAAIGIIQDQLNTGVRIDMSSGGSHFRIALPNFLINHNIDYDVETLKIYVSNVHQRLVKAKPN